MPQTLQMDSIYTVLFKSFYNPLKVLNNTSQIQIVKSSIIEILMQSFDLRLHVCQCDLNEYKVHICGSCRV